MLSTLVDGTETGQDDQYEAHQLYKLIKMIEIDDCDTAQRLWWFTIDIYDCE